MIALCYTASEKSIMWLPISCLQIITSNVCNILGGLIREDIKINNSHDNSQHSLRTSTCQYCSKLYTILWACSYRNSNFTDDEITERLNAMPKVSVLGDVGANGLRQHTSVENRSDYAKLRLCVHGTHELEILILCKPRLLSPMGHSPIIL